MDWHVFIDLTSSLCTVYLVCLFGWLFVLARQELSSLLSMEAMTFVTEDRKNTQELASPNTYTFDLFGGVDVSYRLLVGWFGCQFEVWIQAVPLSNYLQSVCFAAVGGYFDEAYFDGTEEEAQ